MPSGIQILGHCNSSVDVHLLPYINIGHASSSKSLHATPPEAMVALPSI